MNRDAMEAHLTLHGWQPANIGAGAAVKDGWVVYLCNGAPRKHRFFSIPRVEVQTVEGLNLYMKLQPKLGTRWWLSDALFWPLANRCVEWDKRKSKEMT